jgi:hypothetical protein
MRIRRIAGNAIETARRAGHLFLIGFAFAAAMVYMAIRGADDNAGPGGNADGP